MSLSVRSTVLLTGIAALAIFAAVSLGQTPVKPKYQTQEYSETDGIPVLIKHLPDWESKLNSAAFAHDAEALKAILGDRPSLGEIDFAPATEAVAAAYPAGKLLIVEYASPQLSSDADKRFRETLAGSNDQTTVYRRIGNYNAFVFDAKDPAAAEALLDQVKYEKDIQWLGDNPFRISAERAFVLTTSDIFLSTVLVIVIGIGISIFGGSIAGFIYFMLREKRRAAMTAYTDAGGMTRLNLDGFTPEVRADRLLR